MAKFRKKPVVIEAVQWNGNNTTELLNFANTGESPLWGDDFKIDIANKTVHVLTSEGTMIGNLNDWIIRGIKGELYPCKPDIFTATYEPV